MISVNDAALIAVKQKLSLNKSELSAHSRELAFRVGYELLQVLQHRLRICARSQVALAIRRLLQQVFYVRHGQHIL